MFFAMLLFLIVNALLVPHTSADCPDLGGYLAEINDRDQENHIDSFLNDAARYWIGLNDLSEEG